MNFMKIFAILLIQISFAIQADEIKINDIHYKKISNKLISIKISLDREYDVLPTLTVKKNIIQLAMPEASVWPSIKKSIQLGKKKATLMAYQYNKGLARVRFLLPGINENLLGKIKVKVKDNNIILNIPYRAAQRLKSFSKTKQVSAKNIQSSKYDETYLDQLLKSDKKKENNIADQAKVRLNQDSVKFLKSAVKKKKTSKFSVMTYIGKFAAFLGIILLGFYGVMTLLKKGAFSKNKLGFLNSTKVVEILSNTYLGPKKNLVLVRAHNQVFLVGNSEHGLQLISEVQDVSGIIKNGEKDISGTNFDSNLELVKLKGNADKIDKKFKLKDEINKSTPVKLYQSKSSQFKDQLKEKVKNLKAMQ